MLPSETLQHDVNPPPHGRLEVPVGPPRGVGGGCGEQQAERATCPWCSSSRVVKNGTFRLASGDRAQRYLCRACRRTFVKAG